jgi:hypothetical protein
VREAVISGGQWKRLFQEKLSASERDISPKALVDAQQLRWKIEHKTNSGVRARGRIINQQYRGTKSEAQFAFKIDAALASHQSRIARQMSQRAESPHRNGA